MQKEGKDITVANKDIEEVLPKNRRDISFQFIWQFLVLLLLISMLTPLVALFKELLVPPPGFWNSILVASILGFIVSSFVFLPIHLIINGSSLIKTVIISSKVIKYSSIFKKIDCDWKDISIIEVVTRKQIRYGTGEIVSSKIGEYIIHTTKGTFSIEVGNTWDNSSISKVYDTIVSRSPDIEIVRKDVESFATEGPIEG